MHHARITISPYSPEGNLQHILVHAQSGVMAKCKTALRNSGLQRDDNIIVLEIPPGSTGTDSALSHNIDSDAGMLSLEQSLAVATKSTSRINAGMLAIELHSHIHIELRNGHTLLDGAQLITAFESWLIGSTINLVGSARHEKCLIILGELSGQIADYIFDVTNNHEFSLPAGYTAYLSQKIVQNMLTQFEHKTAYRHSTYTHQAIHEIEQSLRATKTGYSE